MNFMTKFHKKHGSINDMSIKNMRIKACVRYFLKT